MFSAAVAVQLQSAAKFFLPAPGARRRKLKRILSSLDGERAADNADAGIVHPEFIHIAAQCEMRQSPVQPPAGGELHPARGIQKPLAGKYTVPIAGDPPRQFGRHPDPGQTHASAARLRRADPDLRRHCSGLRSGDGHLPGEHAGNLFFKSQHRGDPARLHLRRQLRRSRTDPSPGSAQYRKFTTPPAAEFRMSGFQFPNLKHFAVQTASALHSHFPV